MDPITHGIAGSLLGNALFTQQNRDRTKVVVFAATLGAVFPDIDTVAEFISRDPLAIVKYHRAITHSFVGLPVFAVFLAWLVGVLARRYKVESPGFALLTLVSGVGIASHIVLDGMTSFGTRMFYPLSTKRVAWDLLFIVDLAFTCIVLLPQVVALIYSDPAKSRARALRMWIVFTIGAVLGWAAAFAAGYPFHVWIIFLASALFAALFFAPAAGGFGFTVTRERWCQAGAVVALLYLFGCSVAHHAAILRAKAFADANHIDYSRMAALPVPPSVLDWGDAIRTPDGIYESRFDFRAPGPPLWNYIPDSPPDPYIARAFAMPNVLLYWEFARFPSVHSFASGQNHIVVLGENRFSDGRRGPQPFTYEIVFDRAGKALKQGWLRGGMGAYEGEEMPQAKPGPAAVTGPQGAGK